MHFNDCIILWVYYTKFQIIELYDLQALHNTDKLHNEHKLHNAEDVADVIWSTIIKLQDSHYE